MKTFILVAILVTTFDDHGTTVNADDEYNETVSTSTRVRNETKYLEADNCSLSLRDRNTEDEQLDDLRTRNCTCDEQCTVYNDCCNDSKYYYERRRNGKKFSCVFTAYNGSVYMVHKCPSNYPRNAIFKYCETDDKIEQVCDVSIFTPVTGETDNTTYKNMFCALCHAQTKFTFWDLTPNYKFIVTNDSAVTENVSHADGEKIPAVFRVANSTYKRSYVDAIMPIDLISRVRFCRADHRVRATPIPIPDDYNIYYYIGARNLTDRFSQLLRELAVNFSDPLFATSNHCDYTPLGSSAWELLWPRNRTIVAIKTEGEPDIESCFFKTSDGRLCLINKNLTERVDFEYVDENTIVVQKYRAQFKAHEWIRQTNDTIFLCGTVIPYSNRRKFFQQIIALITEVLVKLSLLFLVAHLAISSTGSKLQSLPNRIMFSYSVTLFVIYITWEMSLRFSSSTSSPASVTRVCVIVSVVEHYLCLCCFTWLLIASYDCWLVVCRTSEKFQNCAGKARLKRYLAYCLWGWISPLSIMAVAVYFELAPNSVIPCRLKPGYGRLGNCFIGQEIANNYFYQYPSAVITCVNVVLFLRTSYQIFVTKRKGISSTAQNNSYVIFMKLSLNMGIVAVLIIIWTIYILVTETDYIVFHLLQHIIEGSQGIFMFFAFSFDKNKMNEIFSILLKRAYQKRETTNIGA